MQTAAHKLPMPKPVYVLTGFLGAGKTTYLNQLIKSNKLGANSLVIVNDFGSINLDFTLIEAQDQQVIELSNGCICCSIRGSLADELTQLTKQPWFESVQDVYIETSGIAKPKTIIETLHLARGFTLSAITTLVDVSQVARWRDDQSIGDIWLAQVQVADLVLVNRVSKEIRDMDRKAMNFLKSQVKQTGIIRKLEEYTSDDNVYHLYSEQKNTALFVPQIEANNQAKIVLKTAHAGISSFTFQDLTCNTKQTFAELLSKHQHELLRLKGYVYVKSEQKAYLVQLSGTRLSWQSLPKQI